VNWTTRTHAHSGSELNGGKAEFGPALPPGPDRQHREVAPSAEMSIQQIIDLAHTAGEVCWIAHPSWCSISGHELFGLNGIIGSKSITPPATTASGGASRPCSGTRCSGAAEVLAWRWMTRTGTIPTPSAAGSGEVSKPHVASIVAAIRDGAVLCQLRAHHRGVQFDGRDMTLRCTPAQEVRLVHPNPAWLDQLPARAAGPYTEVQWTIPEGWGLGAN